MLQGGRSLNAFYMHKIINMGVFLPGCGLCSGFEWERLQEMQVWLLKTPLAVNLLFGFLPFLLQLFGQTLNNGEYM